MKKVLAVVFVLFNAIFTFAQNATDWQKFSPDGEEFTVEVPDKFTEAVTVLKDADKQNVFAYGRYKTYFNGVYYFIFSELADSYSKNKLPALSDGIQPFIKQYSESPKIINFGKFTGSKYELKDTENFYHTIIFLKANKRSYTFHTIREESVADETERFFKSIKFHEVTNEAKEQSVEEVKRNIISARNNNNNINVLPNTPAGVGNDAGTVNRPAPAQPIQTTNSQTKGITITSKPRANYTDLARNYGITGLVQLRVTFLSNGEIGSISPVKRLPFGLTTTATYAAKQITFEPAMFEGKKVTVTKQVQYSFILY